MEGNTIELDMIAVEMRAHIARITQETIVEARKIRSQNHNLPDGTIGAQYVDLANAADNNAPEKELTKKTMEIMNSIAVNLLALQKESE